MNYFIKSKITKGNKESLFEQCKDFIAKVEFVYKNVYLQVLQLEKEKLTSVFLILVTFKIK